MEDEDDLLQSGQCTDEDSLSESEEIPQDKPDETLVIQHLYTDHTKLEFFTVKFLLIFSSTAIVILLPLYLEAVNKTSDAYTMIYLDSWFILLFILLATVVMRRICPKFRSINIWKPPLPPTKMIFLAILYFVGGFMIVYAVDRKRVICHLQDPIKGVLLVFALVNYFFFCQKMMGLQRIFSATTIIVGLFISVDYGLCDEFRCRGNEREHRSDDAGSWTWQTHASWAAVYIVGLYLLATFYTLLDRYLVFSETIIPSSLSNHLLATVSRIVAFQNSAPQLRTITTGSSNKNNISTLHFALYVQLLAWAFSGALAFTDMIPMIGKGQNATDMISFFKNGLECHFMNTLDNVSCGYTTLYGWMFIAAYIVFLLASVRFLILCQSAVYTVACMTASLPIVGVWWSLFRMTSYELGSLVWAPTVTGELICALLGLPIVLIGLILLCKSHFKDCKLSKMNVPCLTATQLA